MSFSLANAQQSLLLDAINLNNLKSLNSQDTAALKSGEESLLVENSLVRNSFTGNKQFKQELEFWESRALDGDASAQFKLGALYTNTQYSEPDIAQAIHWYTLATEQNHSLAQYNLGHHYLNGIGVVKDIESAMQLWLKAAKQDHPSSQFNVGRAYYFGIGLPMDLTQAQRWFERAASNNEPKSIELLKQVKWDELSQTSQSPSTEGPTELTISETTNGPYSPKKLAVTLYTDPAINHYPISIVQDSTELEIVKQSSTWTAITHSDGFPVWVHADFVNVAGSQATVIIDDINIRSEPLIIHGNIVATLSYGETLDVLTSSKRWHQVIAPSYVQAWVKTSQLSLSAYINSIDY